MTRPRFYAAALLAAAVLGAGGAAAAQLATPSHAPAAVHVEPHRTVLALPVRPIPAPADPLAALAADGAGSAEDVTRAACTGDRAALAADGWTPEQLAQLPAVAAVACPTDSDPAPAAPYRLPADPCAWGVDQYEAAGMTATEALVTRTPCARADAAHQAATVATASPAPARRAIPAPTRSTPSTTARPSARSSAPATVPDASTAGDQDPTTPTASPTAAPTATGPGHTPPCATGTAWNGTTCAAPQADAERIGRTVTTTDGRTCTLTGTGPDAWTCTRP